MLLCVTKLRYSLIMGGETRNIYCSLHCSGSIKVWYGSGSSDPYLWLMDPDLALFFFFFSNLQDGNQISFLRVLLIAFWRYIIHHLSQVKSHKEIINSRNQGFSYYFCSMIGGSESGSGTVPLTNESGSGRPKNFRIRNTSSLVFFVSFVETFILLLARELRDVWWDGYVHKTLTVVLLIDMWISRLTPSSIYYLFIAYVY